MKAQEIGGRRAECKVHLSRQHVQEQQTRGRDDSPDDVADYEQLNEPVHQPNLLVLYVHDFGRVVLECGRGERLPKPAAARLAFSARHVVLTTTDDGRGQYTGSGIFYRAFGNYKNLVRGCI